MAFGGVLTHCVQIMLDTDWKFLLVFQLIMAIPLWCMLLMFPGYSELVTSNLSKSSMVIQVKHIEIAIYFMWTTSGTFQERMVRE